MSNLLSIPVTLTDGTETTIADLAGEAAKAVIVVNVASKCGFTPQYAALEQLWQQERSNGLLIVGMPCDQFMKQEFADDTEIAQFCTLNYGVTFPILKRGNVRGRNKHPLFELLLDAKDAKGRGGFVRWNFEKFVVTLETGTMQRFRSTVEPASEEFTSAVRAALV